jgi:hypothetical protein
MRLSTAIALGRTILRPAFGSFSNGEEGCALGMAAEAANIETPDGQYIGKSFSGLWPWMLRDTFDCPCDCPRLDGRKAPPTETIIHLFDFHVMTLRDWTLDQLIDWVRLVEPQEAEAPPSVPDAVAQSVVKCPQ